MSDLLLQWFSCCSFQHQSQNSSRRHQQQHHHNHHRRRHHIKIDRSMIGSPTNFVHTGHIGSADAVELSTSHLQEIQKQMESKGGYTRVKAY